MDQITQPNRFNRNAKASVFEDLFSDPKNLLALYKALHPEDTAATEADLKHVELRNILTKGRYNDLGFMVGSRLMILVEAQSTWSVNIIPRCFMYLADTWNQFFIAEGSDLYSSKAVTIPEPELYVIYTGDKQIDKKSISLTDEFFGGKETAVETIVTVLQYDGGTDIIDQYITFCKVLDGQREEYPEDPKMAVQEAIRICMEEGVLEEYLHERAKEVVNIMLTLYSQEQATKMMLAAERKEALAEGRAEGRAEGKTQQAKETAKSLYALGIEIEKIAQGVGYTVDDVKKWVGLPS